MPPELLQRFLALSTRAIPPAMPEEPTLNSLTSREVMVAEQVARGASNREIAEALEITERTVKAHLSAIFEKLEVRDRVQLALRMNNIPTSTTVN
jgi:DNA-binding NarL/FixJ family response regulator